MIGRLKGVLVDTEPGRVIIDCGGVGYEVLVSAHTQALLSELGTEVTLRVYTHAQETRIALYGFATPIERQLFDHLIAVASIGPTAAIGILSGGAPPVEIAQMIASGDHAKLTKLRGVGKRTAERLVVELKEKCELLIASIGAGALVATTPPRAATPSDRPPVLDEVAAALCGLGWRPAEAESAVATMQPAPDQTLEQLLRLALRSMPR